MGKKKDKKKKQREKELLLSREMLDTQLDDRYGEAYDSIQAMNRQIYLAEQREIRKMRKEGNLTGGFLSDERLQARVRIIKQADERNWFTKVTDLLIDVMNHGDVIKLFARAVVSFLISLLSLDTVKKYISPEILGKIDKVYDIAINV